MGTMHISMRMKSIIPRPRVVDCRIKCEFLLVFCFFCAIWCMCHSSSSSSSSFLIIPLIQRMAKLLTSCRKIGSPPIAKTGFKCGNESIMWTWHPSIFVGIVYPSTYLDICSSIIWDSQGIWAYSWRGILVISRPICKSSLFMCRGGKYISLTLLHSSFHFNILSLLKTTTHTHLVHQIVEK